MDQNKLEFVLQTACSLSLEQRLLRLRREEREKKK